MTNQDICWIKRADVFFYFFFPSLTAVLWKPEGFVLIICLCCFLLLQPSMYSIFCLILVSTLNFVTNSCPDTRRCTVNSQSAAIVYGYFTVLCFPADGVTGTLIQAHQLIKWKGSNAVQWVAIHYPCVMKKSYLILLFQIYHSSVEGLFNNHSFFKINIKPKIRLLSVLTPPISKMEIFFENFSSCHNL